MKKELKALKKTYKKLKKIASKKQLYIFSLSGEQQDSDYGSALYESQHHLGVTISRTKEAISFLKESIINESESKELS